MTRERERGVIADIDMMRAVDGELDRHSPHERALLAAVNSAVDRDSSVATKAAALREIGELVRGRLELATDEQEARFDSMWAAIDDATAVGSYARERDDDASLVGVSRAVTPIGPARAVGSARRRRASSHFGDYDRASTHESSGWLAGFFDRYRLPMLSSIISAGAVAAIALLLRRPDVPPANPVVTDPTENVATKDQPAHSTATGTPPLTPSLPGGGSNAPHPVSQKPRGSAPQVESLDVAEGMSGTVLALEDEDGGNTGVIWVTPTDTTDTL